ncbi:carbohydrate deacetylase isoform X3 [Microcebus murinus]|uniref:carbohydrate deacetylase isoform X3 n=1 Tax=Microcebus murinus TaxID=30608 RepID=UPI003F6B8E6C
MARPRVRLVVTADDFGYCPRRDEGIVEAFLAGAVTSVSLLVNGAAAESAAELARRHGIPTGLHANLSEGLPVGPARHGASTLLSPEGFFLGKMGFREAVAAGDVALPQPGARAGSRRGLPRELLRDPQGANRPLPPGSGGARGPTKLLPGVAGQGPHTRGRAPARACAPRRVPGVRRGAAGLRGALHTAAAGARRGRLRVAGGPSARLRLRRGARRPGRRGLFLPPRPAVDRRLRGDEHLRPAHVCSSRVGGAGAGPGRYPGGPCPDSRADGTPWIPQCASCWGLW